MTGFAQALEDLADSLTRAIALAGVCEDLAQDLREPRGDAAGVSGRVGQAVTQASRSSDAATAWRELCERLDAETGQPDQVDELVESLVSEHETLHPLLQAQLTRDVKELTAVVNKEEAAAVVKLSSLAADGVTGVIGRGTALVAGALARPKPAGRGAGDAAGDLQDAARRMVQAVDERVAQRWVTDAPGRGTAPGVLASLVDGTAETSPRSPQIDPVEVTETNRLLAPIPSRDELVRGHRATRLPEAGPPDEDAPGLVGPGARTGQPDDPAAACAIVTPIELRQMDPQPKAGALPRPPAEDRPNNPGLVVDDQASRLDRRDEVGLDAAPPPGRGSPGDAQAAPEPAPLAAAAPPDDLSVTGGDPR
ncbi:MAG: hypothetical protein JOY78_18495 [Pseudonocardia sp.]|nr:hypothetical protein [Pseudonocardia sp.]